jgi:NAD-dependent deacetylase
MTSQLITEHGIAQVLLGASKIVVLTGAGLSAESGVPSFGDDGFEGKQFAMWDAYNRKPNAIWRWWQQRRRRFSHVRPNAGHCALVEIQDVVPGDLVLITENTDGLHTKAGCDDHKLFEIHGNMNKMRCDEKVEGACLYGRDLNKSSIIDDAQAVISEAPIGADDEKDEFVPLCDVCDRRMRHNTLWFDECYNQAFYKGLSVLEIAQTCDVLLVIGSKVTNSLPKEVWRRASENKATIIKMDSTVELKQQLGAHYIQAECSNALPKVVAELQRLLEERSESTQSFSPKAVSNSSLDNTPDSDKSTLLMSPLSVECKCGLEDGRNYPLGSSTSSPVNEPESEPEMLEQSRQEAMELADEKLQPETEDQVEVAAAGVDVASQQTFEGEKHLEKPPIDCRTSHKRKASGLEGNANAKSARVNDAVHASSEEDSLEKERTCTDKPQALSKGEIIKVRISRTWNGNRNRYTKGISGTGYLCNRSTLAITKIHDRELESSGLKIGQTIIAVNGAPVRNYCQYGEKIQGLSKFRLTLQEQAELPSQRTCYLPIKVHGIVVLQRRADGKWMATNRWLKSKMSGLRRRIQKDTGLAKQNNGRIRSDGIVHWGQIISVSDDGDGWVKFAVDAELDAESRITFKGNISDMEGARQSGLIGVHWDATPLYFSRFRTARWVMEWKEQGNAKIRYWSIHDHAVDGMTYEEAADHVLEMVKLFHAGKVAAGFVKNQSEKERQAYLNKVESAKSGRIKKFKKAKKGSSLMHEAHFLGQQYLYMVLPTQRCKEQ